MIFCVINGVHCFIVIHHGKFYLLKIEAIQVWYYCVWVVVFFFFILFILSLIVVAENRTLWMRVNAIFSVSLCARCYHRKEPKQTPLLTELEWFFVARIHTRCGVLTLCHKPNMINWLYLCCCCCCCSSIACVCARVVSCLSRSFVLPSVIKSFTY